MGNLTDKYCIVGVGETLHMRPSNRTTLSMACEAVKKAMANAGLEARDIATMVHYPRPPHLQPAFADTAPEARTELSAWLPPTPADPPSSPNAAIASVLPSPLIATPDPNSS